jgi:MFS family permease
MFIVMGGEAADAFGARRSSAAGAALFAVASLIIAVAPNGAAAVAARALQGFGAAFAVPGTLAAITEAVPDQDRPRAIGAWTGFLMLGFSIGPLVGGVVTHYAGWRFAFALNVLMISPAALVLWLWSAPSTRQTKGVDWLGLGLLGFFMLALVFGLHALPNARSAPQMMIVPLALAVVAFAAVVWAERRHPRPLLEIDMFRNRNFALGCAVAFLLMFDIMGLLLYYNLFAQSVDGLAMTAIATGFSLLPLSLALFVFARAAPMLIAKIGLRVVMVGASLLLVLGCAIAWASEIEAGFLVLMLGFFVMGAGIALPFGSAPRIALASLPLAQAGKGSGVINSCSFLGGTVGVTCGGIVFGIGGFADVLALVALCALISAGLALRLRTA